MKRIVIAVAGLLAIGLIAAGCTKSEEKAATTEGPKPAVAIEIEDAWARESVAMANAGAVYMKIKNGGSKDDKLLSASVSPEVAAKAELHETKTESTPAMSPGAAASPTAGMKMRARRLSQSATEDRHEKESDSKMSPSPIGTGHSGGGMTKMSKVASISIPAGKTVKLEPGGYHVMLLELKKPLKPGDSIQLTLTFENAGKKDVTAQVREA